MRSVVERLIAKITEDDKSARDDAIYDLMVMMEESTRSILKNVAADDENLSQNEQVELIHVLIELAESLRPEYAGLLWVVSKANPIILMEPIQSFVLKYAKAMPDVVLHQALVGVQNCMVSMDSGDYDAIKERFKCEQLMAELSEVEVQDYWASQVLQNTLSGLEIFCSW